MKISPWALVTATGLAVTAAQGRENRWEVVVSNVISPDQPSATVDVWVVFDADQYAFAGAAFDVFTESDPGGFSDPQCVLNDPGTYDGSVAPDGDAVQGIVGGQISYPGEIFADTANPILVWRATWSTADFAPRTVGLGTTTSKFYLYVDPFTSDSFLDSLIEGEGAIQIVPAPGELVVLAAAGIAAIPRRQRTGGST